MSSSNSKKEILSYLENVSLFLLGVTLLAFPLLFTTLTTDAFTLPKQILLAVSATLSIVVLSIRMIIEGRVRLRTTPFDLPVLLFLVIAFLSTLFAVNRYDALINFVPLFFAVLFFFVMTNVIRGEKAILFSVASFILGTTVAAIISVLSFFKIYVLPFAQTNTQGFTTLGALLDQAIFLAIALPLAGYVAWPVLSPVFKARRGGSEVFAEAKQTKVNPLNLAATVSFALLVIGFGITIYMLATSQKPLILPFVTGFQTGLAAISQDSGRILQGFLFGSGFGTYLTDFARFKQATYNANPTLWSFTFFRSSSYALELLATTGFLGLASFIFIGYRVFKEKSFFLPIVIAFVAAFLLPFSFVLQAVLFLVLAFFAVLRGQQAPARFADLEFYLVTLKHGLILAQPEGERAPHDPVNTRYGKILPLLFVLLIVGIVGYAGFLSTKYVLSDLTFQRSLVAASQNNAQETYNLQAQAIKEFPYRDSYHRVFSQTNLTIANAIANSQPQDSSPSAETQERIVGLIQQSINYGRNAVTISPQNPVNWNALSQTYRTLIGFGQNAEQFAVLTNQQAIALDPANPQQYISLGGIYYQLGAWDEAIRQFQLAANLKQDYANAYYNLGHALESKGDENSLRNALQSYQVVQSLVANEKASAEQVKSEIEALQKKIEGGQAANQQVAQPAVGEESNLNVDQPAAKLPEQENKAEIQAPPKTSLAPSPSPSEAPEVSPSPNL